MNILVLGSGGREHALAWKLRGSSRCKKIFIYPGNAGTRREGFDTWDGVDLKSPQSLVQQARRDDISLVVVGPEALLAEGYADEFRAAGFPVVGPNRDAARLETSKIFAKRFMTAAGIPTADFWIAKSPDEILAKTSEGPWPVVLKLDGLAAGKGVVIAKGIADVKSFNDRIWTEGEFGAGPHSVLGESFIEGDELSYMGLCDGTAFVPLSSATDFKRVGDGNRGPNTGGMGCISPSPFISRELEEKVQNRIVTRVLSQLSAQSLPYRGVLYIGLMITQSGDPYVLEFNARFGDPETQAVLLRLESDFVTVMEHTARGTLQDCPQLKWKKETSLYVVGAAEGYPEKVKTGDLISGLESIGNDAQVFFSGVREKDGSLLTQGGRVLGVGVTAPTTEQARVAAYAALRRIHWRGMHYRSDIGIVES